MMGMEISVRRLVHSDTRQIMEMGKVSAAAKRVLSAAD